MTATKDKDDKSPTSKAPSANAVTTETQAVSASLAGDGFRNSNTVKTHMDKLLPGMDVKVSDVTKHAFHLAAESLK